MKAAKADSLHFSGVVGGREKDSMEDWGRRKSDDEITGWLRASNEFGLMETLKVRLMDWRLAAIHGIRVGLRNWRLNWADHSSALAVFSFVKIPAIRGDGLDYTGWDPGKATSGSGWKNFCW